MQLAQQHLTLDEHRFLRLQHAAGTLVVCLRGELWLTQDGCPDDIVLRRGDCWRVPRDRPVLLGAFGHGLARLLPASHRSPIGRRLRAWLQAVLAGAGQAPQPVRRLGGAP